ncbi:TPA: NAD(P)(+) transhydrogenase (Re/Si-specific) subunit beta [Candidatus Thalassarchaeaceae archaeon]|jgi:NAD(P) transhydrogenase subunit beta|nr:NAD(P)(+) transhydrogenase (Re/Si-specific) subunit beta [Euryarchaeota archaeon]MDG1547177.1 NAD(P)(+) transhydrogenase (Re/Si-specific) subunit beta [Candidatus Thalassarchaeaceae archaeon]DAC63897.1 MAG TPA: NAD(P)(+) transhydrogenase (Re/Si-specific) subunit beta [Candidatus Poseidoniales archaeon]MBT3846468.1 NAD(P)(+) transhydrogenase (Re/Si-specific) subunit beta [Euryarchaeota archaeon]MBT4157108.1 NAD(P)(+) transhydrogenase (Re/Si-specific) subunit beta [Euryarchaeota archaeon]|tara:strand:+ start:4172 stop:5587 length:1416 start_codon:yes stop_codon:yes gene_type:complete
MEDWVSVGYLISASLFIFGLKKLGHPRTAPYGNQLGALGMFVAVITTVLSMHLAGGAEWTLIVAGMIIGSSIGYWMAVKVEMTGMPELVALFNGFGGAASALVALSEVTKYINDANTLPTGLELTVTMVAAGLSALVGWMTLTGSLLAMYKLKGGVEIFGKWLRTPTWGPPWLNIVKVLLVVAVLVLIFMSIEDPTNVQYLWGIIAISCLLGIILVLPIGGADMPVVVSLLNSLSGIAAAFTGFIIGNSVLIIAGSLVGASGLILTFIMCKAMNRTLPDVLFKSFGGSEKQSLTRTKVGSDAEEVAMMVDGAQKIIIVPGYGMAVSQCQHQVKEFADLLEEKFDTEVKYAIHPVAGRMPGHMNVLLAEANVPYEQLIEMDEINSEFPECDMAVVIGANDTCNPAARSGEGPLAGMPIIDADKARTVVIIKRSLSVGYAGVDNDLFYEDKTMMLFGDGKKMMNELNTAIKDL